MNFLIGQDLEKQKNRVERRHEILLRCSENIAVKKTFLTDAIHAKDQIISEVISSNVIQNSFVSNYALRFMI
jgi:hypothetical protein